MVFMVWASTTVLPQPPLIKVEVLVMKHEFEGYGPNFRPHPRPEADFKCADSLNELNLEENQYDETAEVVQEAREKSWNLEWVEQGSRRLVKLAQGKTLRIGSSAKADLQIFESTISALHCILTVKEDQLELEDLESRNGIIVGGASVSRAILRSDYSNFTLGRIRFSAVERQRSGRRNRRFPALEAKGLVTLIGDSAPMQRLRVAISRYASIKAPLLILGESGTGKDLVASALHFESQRQGNYVALNVATLSEQLMDAELFGHERGAFTGAVQRREGAFQRADRGSLFLDEIAEMSPAGQAKLLRVVEDGRVRAVGADTEKVTQVRIITATCAFIEDRVAEGLFREDLFHRLGTLRLKVPPLRERTSDIPTLVDFFFHRISPEVGPKVLSAQALAALKAESWPGNIRQLFGTLYRAAVLSDEVQIEPTDLGLTSTVAIKKSCITTSDARSLLEKCGSISAAARAAKMPRTSFRTLLFK